MKTLVIAEKPSVGRDIARVLKCKQKGDGYLYNDDHIVSWAVGHLVTLKEPEEYDPALKKWKMYDLPIIPNTMELKAIPKTEPQLRVLKKLMNARDIGQIICATDSGREGELIFRYIYQWANCKKTVKRLWISSLTDIAITDGLANMKDGKDYDNLFASARCRAEADWLVGMNATRAFTIRYGSFGNSLPMGRVQTPSLAILVSRHHEIVAFEAKDYWEVHATFRTQSQKREALPLSEGSAEGSSPAEQRGLGCPIEEEYKGIWLNSEGEDRTYNQEQANEIAEKVKDQKGIIESIETEEKRQLPPQLFDLTELQRECNRKLGLSAQDTLTIAQALYEKHKVITYPRTDSRYLSKDMISKLKPTIQAINTPPYDTFANYILGLQSMPINKRIVDDSKVTDHHAIIPTGKKASGLNPQEAAVYDRILRNFLAVFHPAYVYDITTVITRVQGEPFRSKGRMDKQLGWTTIYAHEKRQEPAKNQKKPRTKGVQEQPDSKEEALPSLQKGESVTTKMVDVLFKKTQPPKPYTEATLLSAMEHAGRFVEDEALKEALKSSGLGTPATRAAIIEKLISSGYVERNKKNLIPTEKGIRLISLVPPEMRQPETTGKWERGLIRIASGEMDETRFMESIRRYVTYLVEQAK